MSNELKLILQSVITEALIPIHQRLDQLESRLDKMDNRLDQMEKRLDKTDTRLGQMEKRLDKTDIRLGQMEKRLDKTDIRLGQMEKRLDKTDTRLGQMEKRLDKTDTRLGQIENRLDKVDDRLDLLNLEITTIKMKMATKEDVAEIPAIKLAVLEASERLNQMNSSMVTKEDLHYLDQKMGEHDREIYKIKHKA